MAIINNNVQNVKFLRNQTPYQTHEAALTAIESAKSNAADGTALLARYADSDVIKTIVGFVAESGDTKHITIFDIDGASADVEALRTEINNKLGTGVTSANTATAQLAALSGATFTAGTSSSADTSVEGAKAYAYDLIGTLDYTDAAVAGEYVSQVSQADGFIAVTRVELPSSADTAVAKKVVIAVSEDKGQIAVTRGEITSSAQTIVLTDNSDGGINFDVNIDNRTIVQDETTKALKVASAALTQYVGDGKTIEISAADANNNKTVSTLLTLSSVTPSSTTVKEEYALKNASGETIGSTIKIYKDSSIVSITYITDPSDEHYQNLEYVYIDASGNTQTEYVDMSELVLEAEFASGVTVTDGVAHGVVDPTSEKDSHDTPVDFLTVGADGFKVNGIKAEIDRQLDAVVADLDATVTGATSGNHVTISIEELDGKLVQSGLTIQENDIASATDLATLSAKTITDIDSANGSITVTSANAADGTQEIDIATDASKIKMSGFGSQSIFSGITSSSSITEAFGEVESVIESNERVTAAALTDLNDRVDGVTGDISTISGNVNTISGDVDTIKSNYISGATVNGSAATVTDNSIVLSIVSAPSTGATSSPIDVTTANGGGVTLTFNGIDCGYYDVTNQ